MQFHVVIRARQNHGRMKREICLGVFNTIQEAEAFASQNTFSYVTNKCPYCNTKDK